MNVLIVEDDTVQASYMEAILPRMGIYCTAATTLHEALEVLSHRQFCGVLCDLVLDSGTGIEVAKVCQAKAVADEAIAKAMRRKRDEEALILILSQIL